MSSPKRSDTYDIQNPYKVRPSVSDGLSFVILNKTIKNKMDDFNISYENISLNELFLSMNRKDVTLYE